MQYTDNVVEFMAQDLRKLPKEVLNTTTIIISHRIASAIRAWPEY
jgi:hypothetical protein